MKTGILRRMAGLLKMVLRLEGGAVGKVEVEDIGGVVGDLSIWSSFSKEGITHRRKRQMTREPKDRPQGIHGEISVVIEAMNEPTNSAM